MEEWQIKYEERVMSRSKKGIEADNFLKYINEGSHLEVRNELIEKIKTHFNLHFKGQKIVLNWELDIDKLNKFTDKELVNFHRELDRIISMNLDF